MLYDAKPIPGCWLVTRQDDITSSSDVSSLYLNLHLLLLPSWARGFRIAIYSSTVFIYLDPPRASNFSPQVCFWGWGAQISDPWRIQVYPPGNCPISPSSRHFSSRWSPFAQGWDMSVLWKVSIFCDPITFWEWMFGTPPTIIWIWDYDCLELQTTTSLSGWKWWNSRFSLVKIWEPSSNW